MDKKEFAAILRDRGCNGSMAPSQHQEKSIIAVEIKWNKFRECVAENILDHFDIIPKGQNPKPDRRKGEWRIRSIENETWYSPARRSGKDRMQEKPTCSESVAAYCGADARIKELEALLKGRDERIERINSIISVLNENDSHECKKLRGKLEKVRMAIK